MIDAQATAIGASGNPTVSATTNTAGDLVLATLSRFSTTNATTSRTSIYRDTSNSTLAAGSYQVATSTGSYSDTYTGSAAQDWSMAMVAFKPGSTGGGGSTGSTTINYVLNDNLGGTNVITNSSGTSLVETLDYYPYGSIRIDNKAGSYSGEDRKYIGQPFDAPTQLSYLQSRYYNGAQGQFISQDPVFLGTPNQQNLQNPQSLNVYSYAEDNPVTNEDTNGKQVAPTLASQLQQLSSELEALSATLAAGGSAAAAIVASPEIGITLGAIGAVIGGIALANRTTLPSISTASNAQSTNAFGPTISIGGSGFSPSHQGGTLSFPIENPSSLSQPYSFSQQITGSAPKSVPPGTKPIDKVGLDKDDLHEVKEGIGAGPQDWVGVTPNGDVITTGPDGEPINNGPIDDYTHTPTGLVQP